MVKIAGLFSAPPNRHLGGSLGSFNLGARMEP